MEEEKVRQLIDEYQTRCDKSIECQIKKFAEQYVSQFADTVLNQAKFTAKEAATAAGFRVVDNLVPNVEIAAKTGAQKATDEVMDSFHKKLAESLKSFQRQVSAQGASATDTLQRDFDNIIKEMTQHVSAHATSAQTSMLEAFTEATKQIADTFIGTTTKSIQALQLTVSPKLPNSLDK
jgi:uncharacterized protein YicC (UPF0701 family)